jgi:hypothetical protein
MTSSGIFSIFLQSNIIHFSTIVMSSLRHKVIVSLATTLRTLKRSQMALLIHSSYLLSLGEEIVRSALDAVCNKVTQLSQPTFPLSFPLKVLCS